MQKGADLHTILLAISTTAQFVAAGLAWSYGRRERRRRVWGVLALALFLMGLRRSVALVDSIRSSDASSSSYIAESLALIISLLMIAGIVRLGRLIPAALRALGAESSLGQVLGNSLTEIYIFETATLRFSYVNFGGLSNLGYTMEELEDLTPVALKPLFDEEVFLELLSPLLAGRTKRIEFETVHRRKDGSTYPVQIDLQLSQFGDREVVIAVVLDITKRIEAVRALRDSEEHFRTVIENSSDAVSVFNNDGTIAYESPAVVRNRGDDAAHFIFDLVHPEDKEATAAAVRRIFVEPDRRHQFTFRAPHANGSWRTIDAVGSLRVFNGRPQAVVNQRDVTDQEDARRHQEEVEAKLREAQRMETIGTLAGGVAHDFNNLLTPILFYSRMWSESGKDGADGVEYAREVLGAAVRAQELVQQILTFAREGDHKAVAVDLSLVVGDAIGLIRSTMPTSIEIELRIEDGLMVAGNPSQLHQVVMNLCANAHDAMDRDGTLTVELGRIDNAAAGSLQPAASVRLVVRDTGHGVEQSGRERLFEPFYTTKPVDEGTGLGLAVVHGIVRDHGGTIEVESAVGQGASFTVVLPLVRGSVAPISDELPQLSDVVEFQPRVGGTVLLVEDDQAIRSLLDRILQSHGFEVVARSNGHEAIEALRAEPDRFDLLLTDQTMPRMTGVELIEKMPTTCADLPVVLMTGYGDDGLVARLGKSGVTNVLEKPFAPDDLLRELAAALAGGFRSFQ